MSRNGPCEVRTNHCAFFWAWLAVRAIGDGRREGQVFEVGYLFVARKGEREVFGGKAVNCIVSRMPETLTMARERLGSGWKLYDKKLSLFSNSEGRRMPPAFSLGRRHTGQHTTMSIL